VSGVEMVRRQFLATLEGFDVRRIETLGEPFDPTRHDAVSIVPAATASQDGTIVGVIAPGYALGDEVLRPARVAVAKIP
jgi:molecular chaperone GrpE